MQIGGSGSRKSILRCLVHHRLLINKPRFRGGGKVWFFFVYVCRALGIGLFAGFIDCAFAPSGIIILIGGSIAFKYLPLLVR